jgi:hypothetical protein
MMSKSTATMRGSRRRRSRLLASVCAAALVGITTGNVAAIPHRYDDGRPTQLWIGVSPHLVAKLGTKAGYEVLAFG